MAYSLDVDLGLVRGEDFVKAFRVYSDERVKRWRGVFREQYLYKKGDGTAVGAEAWVAILESKNAEPGGPESTVFWSPLQVLDLEGYTATVTADPEGSWPGFTSAVGLQTTTGRVTISVVKTLFSTAPVDSAHYYVTLTSPLGAESKPIKGTMLFGTP